MSKAHIITAYSPDDALQQGLWHLVKYGIQQPSRNGLVLKAPGPVITEYPHPTRRVMLSALRDANPFFHLYEAIWMLAGRNDAASITRYAKHMETFAENGIFNGVYGYRWRKHFGYDQLKFIVEELARDPMSRRCVLSMWDAGHYNEVRGPGGASIEGEGDPHKARAGSKDVPCNTHVYFDCTDGCLNMNVLNRSNDIVWGAYGANLVHMSFLQEVLAEALGVPVGTYWQTSHNFHAYVERPDVQRLMSLYRVFFTEDRRSLELRHEPPRFTSLEDFLNDCEQAAGHPCSFNNGGYFLNYVFSPMMRAHALHKAGNTEGAIGLMGMVDSEDWRTAGTEWLERRLLKQQEKKNG